MRIDRAEIESYSVILKDKSRPPSRGGNQRAWHRHAMRISGEIYSFLAPWSGKFVYNGETTSFDWDWDESRTYRNVDRSTISAFKKNGEEVVRGERGNKVWRTADTRLPGSRREQRD